MKIRMSDDYTSNVVELDPDTMSVLLTSVFNGVTFMTSDGETLHVCMRESGYELSYIAGEVNLLFTLNQGVVIKNTPITLKNPELTQSTVIVNDEPSYDMFRKAQ